MSSFRSVHNTTWLRAADKSQSRLALLKMRTRPRGQYKLSFAFCLNEITRYWAVGKDLMLLLFYIDLVIYIYNLTKEIESIYMD